MKQSQFTNSQITENCAGLMQQEIFERIELS